MFRIEKDIAVIALTPVVLPPTTGRSEPICDHGVVTGYMEMFEGPKGQFFTVPGASRSLDAEGKEVVVD